MKVVELSAEIDGLKTQLCKSQVKLDKRFEKENTFKKKITDLKAQILAMYVEVDEWKEKDQSFLAKTEEYEKYKEYYFDNFINKQTCDTQSSDGEEDEFQFLTGFDKDGAPVYQRRIQESKDGQDTL